MPAIKTYQSLEAIGPSEQDRMEFIRAVINDHKGSEKYRTAADAELYYAKQNPTISKAQKYVYDERGVQVPDMWSSNYKLTHGFFRRFVIQQVQYVLSNGVTFQKGAKNRLGADFDNRLQELAKKAMIDGVAFGFWNLDHLEVFPFADTQKNPGFAPLYDQDSGLLRAGVRYWGMADDTQRFTLYEEDGYTDYIQRKGEDMEPIGERRPYSISTRANRLGAVESVVGENYPGFPIIPMWASDLKDSELIGIRPSIDCYDFIASGLAGDISDGSSFYWTISNAQGMDDVDLVRFLNKMKQVRAATLGRDATVEAHTLEIPVDASMRMLDKLRSDMYEDFMLLDVEKALSGDKTATSIRLAYQPQDDKCGDFEYCIRDFIAQLLALLGIEDEPSFQWNRIANQMEETQMVMMAAAELDSEAILNKLPWITPEEAEKILKRRAAENLGRFGGGGDIPPKDEDVTGDEAQA